MQDFTLDKGKIAIILAGLFCLYAVYGAVTDFQLPGEAEALEPVQEIVELDPVNIQLLAKTHLFGEPPRAKVAVKRNTSVRNKTAAQRRQQQAKAKQQAQKANKNNQRNTKPVKINVTVTGLLASNDAGFAAAILKVDNKPEKLYRVGEDLGKPEVKLQSVELESVTIDNNGNEQTIAMKRPGLDSKGQTRNNRNANARQSNNSRRNNNRIPELPPELELEGVQGAYSPPPPEPVDLNEPPLPEDLEEELLLEQMENELDQEMREALELEDDVISRAGEESPDFEMPVF